MKDLEFFHSSCFWLLGHTTNLDGLDSKVTVLTLGLFHEPQENEGQPWFGSNYCTHCVHRGP